MSLTDIMSAMQLHSFAEAGLVLFFIAFLSIAIHIVMTRQDEVWERARHLPLDGASDGVRSGGAQQLSKGSSDP